MRAAQEQRLASLRREHSDHHGTDCTVCFLLKLIALIRWQPRKTEEGAGYD